MKRNKNATTRLVIGIGRCLVAAAVTLSVSSVVFAASAPAKVESLEELYEKAKKEGGKLNLYVALSQRSTEVIPPAFMKRFPGVTIDHFDATADKLVARHVAELRGGRVLADVIGGALPYMAQLAEQKLIEPIALPEAAAYPPQLKSEHWVATDTQFTSSAGTPSSSKRAKSRRGSKTSSTRNGKTL